MSIQKHKSADNKYERRSFFKVLIQRIIAFFLVGFGLKRLLRLNAAETRWQIDPEKCVQCGQCAVACVLNPSAVKCVHNYDICGYCNLCFGYFQPGAKKLNEDAYNQLCPTGAINRKFIEEPFFEYSITSEKCIGCAKCVKGCNLFGNGSFHLQVMHDLCQNCNECSIALVCEGNAFKRVPINEPYIKKTK